MGKSSPKAPAAPDPTVTANAQTKSNQETALYNFGLSNPNYNTPLGSLTYTQTGGGPTYNQAGYDKALAAWQAAGGSGSGGSGGSGSGNYGLKYTPGESLSDFKASNASKAGNFDWGTEFNKSSSGGGGGAGSMPQLSDFLISGNGPPTEQATVKLSPEQQQLYDLSNSQSIDLSKLASQLQGRVGDTLNQPVPGSADFATASKNAQDAYYNNQKQYLDPQFSQGQEQLDAKLANQGLTIGSEAYNNEQNNFARQKQSAYDTAQNNAILQGPQNAQQLYALSTAARNQPLTEFNALRTGAQPQMPQFQGTAPSGMSPTNVAGITQQGYQNSLNGYNQQVASNNATTGGLFGLAGSGLGAFGQYAGSAGGSAALTALFAGSDIALKENIIRIGTEKGYPIYAFNYKADPQKAIYRGVMAQEVMEIMPDAVISDGNYLMVNYGMIGIEFGRIH